MISLIQFPTVQNFASWEAFEIVGSMCLILLTGLAAAFLGFFCAREFKGDKRKTILIFTLIAVLLAVMLLAFFGFTVAAIKGIILSLVLAFVSYSDLKTRECPDFPYLMIVVAAFIGGDLHCLPDMLLAALAVFCFQFFGAWATNAKLNGADAKLATACAFLLGSARGITGLVIGMLIGIIVNLIKLKDTKEGFPLLPYLAVGFMTAYFL